jgi:hypothetical protein
MEVDTANTTLPFKKLTDEECAQYCAEGHYFRCRTQGHMAHNCPKNSNSTYQNSANAQTNEAASTTRSSTPSSTTSLTPSTTATVATITTTPATPSGLKLTLAQQIHMLKDKMSEDKHGTYLDAHNMGQYFCNARY